MRSRFSEEHLTVLTSPPGNFWHTQSSLWRHPRTALHVIRHKLKNPEKFACGGHPGVTRSLIQGLQTLRYPFNYNPNKRDISSTCIVLSGFDTLRFAIEQKRAGNINKLLAGPNIVTLPDEFEELIAQPEVDICLVPSLWVKDLYLTVCPKLGKRVHVWAAGVAPDTWIPSEGSMEKKNKDNTVLIYIKGQSGEAMINNYLPILSQFFMNIEILKYGAYAHSDYRKLLDKAEVAFILGDTESQGLALAEAWAMNVPTWVLYVNAWMDKTGKFHPANAAPYLSSETGDFFHNQEDLRYLCKKWKDGLLKYKPREWVLKNMTDAFCAKQLIEMVEKIES